MKKLFVTLIACTSIAAIAGNHYHYHNHENLYLTINNESNSQTRVSTGKIFSYTYDVQPHSSESHWYYGGMVWNVKISYKDKDGNFKELTSCKPFAWYDRSFTIKFYNIPGQDAPACQIQNI